MSLLCFAVISFSLVQQLICNTIEQFLISGSRKGQIFPSFRMNPDDGDAKQNCFLLRDSHVLYFNSYLHERRWGMFGPCLITGGNRGRGGKDSLILSLKKYQTSSYLIPRTKYISPLLLHPAAAQ